MKIEVTQADIDEMTHRESDALVPFSIWVPKAMKAELMQAKEQWGIGHPVLVRKAIETYLRAIKAYKGLLK